MATPKKKTRIPQQRRSVRTRDRILKAAEELFSKRGYYKTNSKQIALRATVAVGSFYAYFRDKKAVLIDLLEYHNKKVFDSLDLFKDSADLDSGNPRQFFIAMIENVLQAHEHLPDFHRDNSFSIYSHPEVKKLDNRFKQAAIEKTMELFEFFGDRLRISDPEAAAVLLTRVIEDTVHGIKYDKEPIGKDRLVSELADMLCLYLLK